MMLPTRVPDIMGVTPMMFRPRVLDIMGLTPMTFPTGVLGILGMRVCMHVSVTAVSTVVATAV